MLELIALSAMTPKSPAPRSHQTLRAERADQRTVQGHVRSEYTGIEPEPGRQHPRTSKPCILERHHHSQSQSRINHIKQRINSLARSTKAPEARNISRPCTRHSSTYPRPACSSTKPSSPQHPRVTHASSPLHKSIHIHIPRVQRMRHALMQPPAPAASDNQIPSPNVVGGRGAFLTPQLGLPKTASTAGLPETAKHMSTSKPQHASAPFPHFQ